MQINRLRLVGFKSFVDATELLIERGLTGVVGPNGCGKSNLLEALRWVMGETSYKSMRAAAMDDVIFSGTTSRPARNSAEVTIFLDNSARTAPAEYNDSDIVEITRRIERDAGSAYRINSREVRARDVKILFEDAATGARSPALVRQGQIGEIVNAKPDQRRRILEDAAGVAGLHSRRHEAELRLKQAEGNLARLTDILGQLNGQLDGLKRQARQARRYKEISGDIRRAEAIQHYLTWTEAEAAVAAEETQLRDVLGRMGLAITAESEATRAEAGRAEAIGPAREAEAVAAAALARVKLEHATLEREAERASQRIAELAARKAQLTADLARERDHIDEAQATLDQLGADLEQLTIEAEDVTTAEADLADRVAAAEAEAETAQETLTAATRAVADARSRRAALQAGIAERQAQADRFAREIDGIAQQMREAALRAPAAVALTEGEAQCAALADALTDIEAAAAEAEDRVRAAQGELRTVAEQAAQAMLKAREIATERATLARMLNAAAGSNITPIVDHLTVAEGYETALGAALGEDLDAPIDATSPVHWSRVDPSSEDARLPEGAEPLVNRVQGPPELRRRLMQIGVVTPELGPRLQPALKPGQRLVTKSGDLWRWDGFVSAAEAPTTAAQRLAQRNRLSELEGREGGANRKAEAARGAEGRAREALAAAEAEERRQRQLWRDTQQQLARHREALVQIERAARETEARLSALRHSEQQTMERLAEVQLRLAEDEAALAAAITDAPLEAAFVAAERAAAAARGLLLEVRTEAASLAREHARRQQQLASLKSEHGRWTQRLAGGRDQIATLERRLAETVAELDDLALLPDQIAAQREGLIDTIATSEAQRSAAADGVAAAEAALRAAQTALREAQAEVGAVREARARIEAHLEGARARLAAAARGMVDALDTDPDGCLRLAGVTDPATLPALADNERQLARLKADRERLGGVNLQAEDELATLTAQFDTMEKERADVEEAIAKLRGGIGQLNREAKKRLDEAFEKVNGFFQSLFTTLFGGGEARLEMIEGEDPLESGLEIIAKPPGKKPATLSLLSGGEQTLTALSLIFAVFLTNPSPICVLDEVDAPLDDANVDRFCTLMEKMAADTETRFLVITHHPMTMARMHRLFGVTMGERGVSQLVSVDLKTAEQIVETPLAHSA